MNRRGSLCCLLALGTATLPAWGQQAAKPARIMILAFGKAPSPIPPPSIFLAAFTQGLRELGYVEGRNIVLVRHWTPTGADDPDALAQELAALKPDVILAGGEPWARAAQRASDTIPIVLAYGGDPVAGGFAKSLARPGGNVTGIATLNEDTSPKLLDLLLTVVPGVSRVAVLANPSVPSHASVMGNLQGAARRAKVELLPVDVHEIAEMEPGFAKMARERIKAVVVLGDPQVFFHRRQIADLALKHGIAAVYPAKQHAEDGGLMSYGVNIADGFRRAASFVDRILKGAKPGDLPIEQATTLELVINMKTAKALGIAIPQSVLLRADRVIE